MKNAPRTPSSKTGWSRRDVLRAGPLLVLSGTSALVRSGQAFGSEGALIHSPRSSGHSAADDIVIENAAFRLVIGGNGIVHSLVEKTSGQECLVTGSNTPAFSMTQYMPLPGQLILLYPADAKSFPARQVRREGDLLEVTFEGVPFEVGIRLKVAQNYVAFTVEQTRTEGKAWDEFEQAHTPIEELIFLDLPLRERTNFGSWLNVMWDDEVAVNLLAANPWCRIGSELREKYRLVRATAEDRVKTTGVTAVLVASRTSDLLDRIAEVENDFNLPRGVESRRRKEYKYFYYWADGITPANADRHLSYARQGGFRGMMISHFDFAKSAGHFPWKPEYPGGQDDLRALVRKIKDAGLLPGLHIHYNKAHREDPYVSGHPDPRLNLTRVFTLAAPLGPTASVIHVEENPSGVTLDDERRLLKLRSELITFEKYSTTPPYQFTGCQRAQMGTTAGTYEAGTMFGLLDVDTWSIFVRFSQNTTIQAEVARRIAALYGAGFEFVHFDGTEDVPPPYWFNCPWAQCVVYEGLEPRPLFAEGAERSHFNWHLMSRSNPYDKQEPESTRTAMRVYQEAQAPEMVKNFSSMNFGWMGYKAPNGHSIGTQPDMVEYVISRAAGWDCAFSIWPELKELDAHPRTPDNLEVMWRWQEIVIRGWLNESQKASLRNQEREHLLLVDEMGDFELVSYEQISGTAGADRPVRAFVFERKGKSWVVFWHTLGRGVLEVPFVGEGLRLWKELGKTELSMKRNPASIIVTIEGRQYLECAGFPRSKVVRAFQNSKVLV